MTDMQMVDEMTLEEKEQLLEYLEEQISVSMSSRVLTKVFKIGQAHSEAPSVSRPSQRTLHKDVHFYH